MRYFAPTNPEVIVQIDGKDKYFDDWLRRFPEISMIGINEFGIRFFWLDSDIYYFIDDVLIALRKLSVKNFPFKKSSMFDVINAVANGISGDEAKDIFKELTDEDLKRWGFTK